MQDVHTAITEEKNLKILRYLLAEVNNILCYGENLF